MQAMASADHGDHSDHTSLESDCVTEGTAEDLVQACLNPSLAMLFSTDVQHPAGDVD